MNLNGVVGPEDQSSFRNIMICCVTIGAIASAIFHYFVNPLTNDENRMNAALAAADEESERQGRVVPLRRMSVMDWFKEPQFYQVKRCDFCIMYGLLIKFDFSGGRYLHVH